MSQPEPRLFAEPKLVVATHNPGKAQEIAAMLGNCAAEILTAADFSLPAPEETGVTFEENALIKARFVTARTGLVALADDSGLCIPDLDGQPGVYTADWAVKPDGRRDYAMAMDKINAALCERGFASVNGRPAYFACTLALAWPDGHQETVEGRVTGHLVWPPRGSGNFAYDPLFVPDGETRTFAEMEPEEKNTHSHRAAAVRALRTRCFKPSPGSS